MSNYMEDKHQLTSDLDKIKPYFDYEFYRICYPELEGSESELILEYYLTGWMEFRDPSACFSTKYYLTKNEDVWSAGINPLLHYIQYGNGEKRTIFPSSQDIKTQDENIDLAYDALKIRLQFDSKFYIEKNADVASAGIDPVLHYCKFGWKELRDPTPNFSTYYYLDMNEDVRKSGVNPFAHYLSYGMQEGRPSARMSANLETETDEEVLTSKDDLNRNNAHNAYSEDEKLIADFFDRKFYLSKYVDIKLSDFTALQHYCTVGWKEGRDPSLGFSTEYYLANNPDVASSGINPFLHYILTGKDEGRQPVSPGGYKLDILKNLLPLEEEVQHWIRPSVATTRLMEYSELREESSSIFDANNQNLIVSFGHDNYLTESGGVQICIQREQLLAQANGFTYLNIYPLQPLPRFSSEKADTKVVLILNGRKIGTCSMSTVNILANNLRPHINYAVGVVHHLLGHSPEEVSNLLKTFGAKNCFFWLHDFFSICTSFTLQRNNVTFCGAPSLNSNSCDLCRYGYDRKLHLSRIKSLFSELKMHIISPSEVTKAFWSSKTSFNEHSITVNPHLELNFIPKNNDVLQSNTVTNIAFIGYPAPHKGWNIYEELATRYLKDNRYAFFYFGKENINVADIKHVFVNVSSTEPNSMIDALKTNKIDVVIHWASWPETFSFSTYEAIASGSIVVTNSISGNVAATVQGLQAGEVLSDITKLIEAFETGTVVSWGRKARDKRSKVDVVISSSNMSIELIKMELKS